MKNKKEKWSSILGQENRYDVSSFGRIKSLSKPCKNRNGTIRHSKELILKNRLRGNEGYYFVSFYNKYLYTTETVHRLVATAFIPNPLNLPCVNHKDGNKLNNNVENLEWCTYSENAIHAHAEGLHVSLKGEKHLKAKLNDSKVLAIRRLYKINKNLNRIEIAKKLGVASNTITCIINNKTWRHLL